MRRFWYRRILLMLLVFTISVGGSGQFLEMKKQEFHIAAEADAAASSGTFVFPGGMPVGIYLKTDGVMVLGTQKIQGEDGDQKEPALHLVKAGDYITAINERPIQKKSELIKEVQALNQSQVKLKIARENKDMEITFDAVKCENHLYKLGIWVRDNAQGLGTITYVDAESHFGALGHGIHDVDTGKLIKIQDGTLYQTSIKDIHKGVKGTPGGMEGIIIYNNYNVLGSISENTESGIYGSIRRTDAVFSSESPMEIASCEEIESGPAVIRCSVDGTVKEYQIEIKQVNPWVKDANKRMTIEITDPELLQKTGGIIQGMSGSPIIQHNKLVGAVTHVLIHNPAQGYAIPIQDMIKH